MNERLAKRQSLYGFESREVDNRYGTREKVHDIKQLWQRSHEIIGLALRGIKQKKIAEMLNISEACVSNTLNSELGQEKLSELRKSRDEEFVKVATEVDRLAKKCMDVYEEILDSPNATLSLKKETADTLIMDIGGHRAPTKIDTRSTNLTASLEEIEEFKKLGIEAAKDAGFLITLKDEKEINPDDCMEEDRCTG